MGKNKSEYRGYRDLECWQKADDLVVEIYRVTKQFPKEEIYGLASQMRRASVSVAANIAEGSARQHRKEYIQFLYLAQSSLTELGYYIHLAWRLNYIKEETYKQLDKRHQEIGKMLNGFIKWLKAYHAS